MPSISVQHASVLFSIYGATARSLKARVLGATTGGRIGTSEDEKVTVRALDDITLSLQHGDRLALIGHNGAGKSTLLRLLAGIYEPVCGEVQINGSVAPILDVSGGMDFDSTGFENIVLRGLYLGFSRAEISERRDEIAQFCGLGSFLDMPLRTYSAGMQTRLAFAISTSVDPEILILDESVGAGDAAFLNKAERRLDELVERSGILVLASHSEETIRRACTTAAMMERGRMVSIGDVDDILALYAERSAIADSP